MIALALCACASESSPRSRKVSGVILVMGGDEGLFTWDENGRVHFVVPDSVKAAKEIDVLSASTGNCIGKLYDAVFTVGIKKKSFRGEAGIAEHTPLLNIAGAELTQRPDEQLRGWLHEADMSASGICKAGAGSRPHPMTDDFVTGSRVLKRT